MEDERVDQLIDRYMSDHLDLWHTSLRDSFAKAALIGLLSKGLNQELAVEDSFCIADKMMKERDKK